MKFMLMMHAPRGTGDWAVADWKPEDLRGHIGFMAKFAKDLKEAGEWVAGEGLASPGQARIVRAGKGEPEVTDGPFAETKEFLAGYWIVDVDSAQRAYAIAAAAKSRKRRTMAPRTCGASSRSRFSLVKVDISSVLSCRLSVKTNDRRLTANEPR